MDSKVVVNSRWYDWVHSSHRGLQHGIELVYEGIGGGCGLGTRVVHSDNYHQDLRRILGK